MNRTTAIIITVVAALLCGCPGLALVGSGVVSAFGSQMPEIMAEAQRQNPTATPQDALMGGLVFLCVGAVLILIPFAVGFFTLRKAKSADAAVNEYNPPL